MHTSAKFCIKLNKVAAAQLRPPAGLTAAHMPSGHTYLPLLTKAWLWGDNNNKKITVSITITITRRLYIFVV